MKTNLLCGNVSDRWCHLICQVFLLRHPSYLYYVRDKFSLILPTYIMFMISDIIIVFIIIVFIIIHPNSTRNNIKQNNSMRNKIKKYEAMTISVSSPLPLLSLSLCFPSTLFFCHFHYCTSSSPSHKNQNG